MNGYNPAHHATIEDTPIFQNRAAHRRWQSAVRKSEKRRAVEEHNRRYEEEKTNPKSPRFYLTEALRDTIQQAKTDLGIH